MTRKHNISTPFDLGDEVAQTPRGERPTFSRYENTSSDQNDNYRKVNLEDHHRDAVEYQGKSEGCCWFCTIM